MSQKRTWHPERSYTASQLGSGESGRGSLHASSSEQEPEQASSEATKTRRKPPIPRRRTPTVYIPAEGAATSADNTPTPTAQSRPNYQTIEPNKRPSLQQLSAEVYKRPNAPLPKNHSSFCGWTDLEPLDMYQSNKMATSDVDRTKLQTPADGYRSSLHSRASSSRYTSSRAGHRTSQYIFHHYEELERHIEDYRNLYSYSALTAGPSLPTTGGERVAYFEGEDIEQDDEVILPTGVRSYRGDAHLRELFHRLGIKEPLPPPLPDWERPRPTPPSIVKKRRNGRDVEIVISNSAPRK